MAKSGRSIYFYTLDHYKADIEIAMDLENIDQRRAMAAAASKRYKQTVLFYWLERVEVDDGVDLTPTLALNLVKGWMGRGIDRLTLNKWFAVTGRTAANKSRDHHRKDELIEKYKEQVDRDIKKAISDMGKVRKAVFYRII
ncbi:hypothetical protein [Methylotuvimicrobium alcaliphilum]|uniref:Uncharacterized protein n=1 Tax=Methylotuvimicrobium alcaliphilum (strain DSM 19304 / NCIMB 14124 / VKM B-2133 / 20Z) TaxID=1091494 RepID=G4T4N0_META2|nr:hypothetical protein [Methylotuvimicrobium alcaliphilum]CCE25786.1 conserved protein of unknown function [Methylotuvimicrobium alcaliphilum 20Z]